MRAAEGQSLEFDVNIQAHDTMVYRWHAHGVDAVASQQSLNARQCWPGNAISVALDAVFKPSRVAVDRRGLVERFWACREMTTTPLHLLPTIR